MYCELIKDKIYYPPGWLVYYIRHSSGEWISILTSKCSPVYFPTGDESGKIIKMNFKIYQTYDQMITSCLRYFHANNQYTKNEFKIVYVTKLKTK